MAALHAKISWERPRKIEKKKIVPTSSYTNVIENSKKKFKKLENTIMASCRAKIRWERPRK